jgi:uncharacterized protein YjlB
VLFDRWPAVVRQLSRNLADVAALHSGALRNIEVTLIESIKETVEKVTGWARPSGREVDQALRRRKPNVFRFADDGVIPNNPELPFILYRSPVRVVGAADPAALFEVLFARNGWKDSWRDGIYDYVHFHSQIHEVLGIARGEARVRFGGSMGRIVKLKAGDIAILPAGTGHQRLNQSDDLLVVGAYPTSGKYDECRASPEEHDRAVKTIPRVAVPKKDPVFGSGGPLVRLWQRRA